MKQNTKRLSNLLFDTPQDTFEIYNYISCLKFFTFYSTVWLAYEW